MHAAVVRLARLVIPMVALSGCSTLPDAMREGAHASLVAAERAFAADAHRHGVRDAFLRHFAPGGLMFAPAPTPVGDVFRDPAPDPLATLLEWEPVASGIAASLDFGFTTGPARMAARDGRRPPRYSTFFSVWKRQGEGPWRVVIDAGVATPGPVAPASLLPAPVVRPASPGADASLQSLLDAERNAAWTRQAFLARLAPDAQVHRDGMQPVHGAAAIAHAWPDEAETLTPLGGDIAATGDLAFTFGAVAAASGPGHYVHLWTRDDAGGAWRIAAALRLP